MTTSGAPSAADAIARFTRHLASGGLSDTTVRIREHYLTEYLRHAREAAADADAANPAVAWLLSEDRALAWLADAAAGKTRTRNTLEGPEASAHANSMRVRTDTFNAFAEYLGSPLRLETGRPEPGDYLTPDDARRLLHDLAIRRPVHANAAASLRTAAMAAVVAATGRTVPSLARLDVRDVHLDDAEPPRVDLGSGETCPLSPEAAQVLARWLTARAAITAELEGSDPGYLWIPVKPGRPRGGRTPVKPGLSRAAVRSLHAAHRTLVSQLLGTPMRPGTLRVLHEERPAG